MKKYNGFFTTILIVLLTLMTGCNSSEESAADDTASAKAANVQAASVATSTSSDSEVSGDESAENVSRADLLKSKGTDQDVVVALVPEPGQENVSEETKIEVTFSVPLDVEAIKEHDVKLTYLSSKTNDHIAGTISYSETDMKLTFTPDAPLEPGLYEVEIKSLKPTKAYKKIHIKEIKYRFFVGGEVKKADPTPTMTLLSIDTNMTIPYARITLELNATDTASLTAINQTLVQEQNRTIKIKGVDNNGTYYLYNLPLIQGSNEINLTATSDKNVSYSMLLDLISEANGSAPIGMRAGSYEGVGSLQTTVQVGTLLKVGEYLFDTNGDGIIDETHAAADSNFTVNYTEEGRYKPRVTIRTIEGPLYSSGDFALSLDVKADANQSDPVGEQPIDIAKMYIDAVINNDRETVERLLGNNERMISYVYGNPKAQQFLAETYGKITSWEQTYHDSGRASVKILINVNGEMYGGGFEMSVVNTQINTGRTWIIRFFY